MSKAVQFSQEVQEFDVTCDNRCSTAEKLRLWNTFGDYMRRNGLCNDDTVEELLNDAVVVMAIKKAARQRYYMQKKASHKSRR